MPCIHKYRTLIKQSATFLKILFIRFRGLFNIDKFRKWIKKNKSFVMQTRLLKDGANMKKLV